MNESFMKEKPVLPLLWSMALPMMVSMLVNSLYNIVDSHFVAQISEDAMTALSLVFPVQNLINAVAIGFGVGISAVISLHLGAEDRESANIAATHGLLLSLLHGILLAVVCIAVLPGFLRMYSPGETVARLGLEYAQIVFAFAPIMALSLFFEKLFQSVGRMKVSMLCLMCGSAANMILDPILISGLGPIPALGIAGAAIATVIGQTLPLVMYLVIYFIRPVQVKVGRRWLVRADAVDRRLYAVGIPAILNLALPSLLISALNAILTGVSQIYVFTLGTYYKLQTFLYLPANGVIQGMRPLIGYNYGAGEHQRVRELYRAGLAINGAIMLLGMVLCQAVPQWLFGLFTTSPDTILAGETALRIISAGFLVSAISITSCGALEGLGKGAPSLMISLLRYVAIIIPVAFFFCRWFGPVGVWNAFWVSETVAAALAFLIYRRAVQPTPLQFC